MELFTIDHVALTEILIEVSKYIVSISIVGLILSGILLLPSLATLLAFTEEVEEKFHVLVAGENVGISWRLFFWQTRNLLKIVGFFLRAIFIFTVSKLALSLYPLVLNFLDK